MVRRGEWAIGNKKSKNTYSVKKAITNEKIVIVTDTRLFAKRDTKGKCLTEFSESMLKEASDKFDSIYVLTSKSFQALAAVVDGCSLNNFKFVHRSESSNPVEIVNIIKKVVLECGGYLEHINNPRLVSHLNIGKYVKPNNIQIASKESWEHLGLTLDKPKTFKDTSAKRKNTAFWR